MLDNYKLKENSLINMNNQIYWFNITHYYYIIQACSDIYFFFNNHGKFKETK